MIDRSLPLLLIGLVLGGGIGFTIAAANGITLDGHDHRHAVPTDADANAPRDGAHPHPTALSLPENDAAPRLQVEAFRDPSAGWNLHLRTENFTFAPRNASRAHVPGEGHAHVHVNGVKHSRIYGPWVHLDDLPTGNVAVEVTLNANDHRPLAVGGTLVAATALITN